MMRRSSVGNRLPQNGDLPLQHLAARPANGLSPFHARLKVEHGKYILVELLVQAPEVSQGELVQLTPARLRERDRSS